MTALRRFDIQLSGPALMLFAITIRQSSSLTSASIGRTLRKGYY
jgi:hypothetical protein